jgi:multiple sugar transport system permease protein
MSNTTSVTPTSVAGAAAAMPPPGPGGSQRATGGGRGSIGTYILLAVGLVFMVAPFLWMLLGSLKPDAEIRRTPPTWLPENPSTDNYSTLFDRLDFPTYFFNSTLVAVVVTLGNLAFASMAGYALAKLEFRGKRLVFALVLATLMIPGMATFIPQFVLVSNLNLTNTYPGLILPFLVAPFGIFLMRQFISGLPNELIHAARVDGAGELRIFFQVILPLCGPALATLAILTFLGSWNNFLWPLVVGQTEDMYTLPVALALYSVGQNRAEYGLLLAGAVVVVLPIILMFLVLQRYFTQGIATTGIK